MPSATDVARFLVQRFIDMGKPATNMKIQKLLYFAWIEYYKKNSGSYLFNDEISAWKFGPVVEPVYREYRIFAAMPITFTEKPAHDLGETVERFLSEFAMGYRDTTARELVENAHRKGTPWYKNYDDKQRGKVIPFSDIIELECR